MGEEGWDKFMQAKLDVGTFDKESSGAIHSASIVGHLTCVLGRVSGLDSMKLQGAPRGIFSNEI